jgi:glycosyltransferase involved in cell wall biosynthesis
MLGPEVTFLTPAYQVESTLDSALGAILKQQTERAFEVLVVDDGSTDRTAEIAGRVANEDPRVRLISKRNGGEASALNAGWREARGAWVAIVEGDVEPRPDWLERCLRTLEADPGVWGVGGALETPREDSWIARLAGYEIERKFASKPREAKHLTSANVVYRREAFEVAGPFDERLVNASLDSVFNGKLIDAGKRLVYEPAARARHHYKTSLWGYLRRQYAYARFRVHNRILDLYPADRFLAAHVALCALGAALTVLAPFGFLLPPPWNLVAFGLGPALLAVALAVEAPQALRIALERGDWAGLLHPQVILLRNLIGAAGYGVGWVRKALGGV